MTPSIKPAPPRDPKLLLWLFLTGQLSPVKKYEKETGK